MALAGRSNQMRNPLRSATHAISLSPSIILSPYDLHIPILAPYLLLEFRPTTAILGSIRAIGFLPLRRDTHDIFGTGKSIGSVPLRLAFSSFLLPCLSCTVLPPHHCFTPQSVWERRIILKVRITYHQHRRQIPFTAAPCDWEKHLNRSCAALGNSLSAGAQPLFPRLPL
jgi:hypothetical protein